jgi:hypothetical protein
LLILEVHIGHTTIGSILSGREVSVQDRALLPFTGSLAIGGVDNHTHPLQQRLSVFRRLVF